MTELAAIFESSITVAVYVYGSLVMVGVLAGAALWLTRVRLEKPVVLSYRRA